MTIQEKCVVSFHYKLTDDNGNLLDSSEGKSPLTYLHGTNNLIPGLEKRLTGKAEGDEFQVIVQPEEAYGQFNPELIKKLPHSVFEEIDDIQPGMRLQSTGPDGQVTLLTVEEIDEQGVTVNGNHLLAGHVLHFDLSVEAIREATDEEINQEHAF